MKLAVVFTLFTLIVIVKGNLIAAVARPAILSIGTIFAVFSQDKFNFRPTEWKNPLESESDKDIT